MGKKAMEELAIYKEVFGEMGKNKCSKEHDIKPKRDDCATEIYIKMADGGRYVLGTFDGSNIDGVKISYYKEPKVVKNWLSSAKKRIELRNLTYEYLMQKNV